MPLVTCPVCSNTIEEGLLLAHVNNCLDQQEQRSSSSPPETETGSKKRKGDTFAALGLRMDSYKKSKKTSDKKKDGPTLTSILIAERKILASQHDDKQTVEQIKTQQVTPSASSDVEADTTESFPASKDAAPATESTSPVAATAPESDAEVQKLRQIQLQSPIISKSKFLQFSEERERMRQEAQVPLAQKVRPKSLKDFFGQEHLLGSNGLLRNIIESDLIPSFILWGPPGVGKTTLARIIAGESNSKFVELSGSDASTKRLREEFENAAMEKKLSGRKTVLFLDEIHRFNKAVQDILLPVIEDGTVTIVGATTENPSFSLNNALLSRVHVFTMEHLPTEAIARIIFRSLFHLNKSRKGFYNLLPVVLTKEAAEFIAGLSGGDTRIALNIIESLHAFLSASKFSLSASSDDNVRKNGYIQVTPDHIKLLFQSGNYRKMYDRNGDSHYDTISAFHKSVRGSDADAAIFYLTKMLSSGEDPNFIIRRMIVIASEDVGLRDSSCLPFVIAAKQAFDFIGLPEGEIILAHCAIKLARAPKSTKSYRALRSVQALLKEKPELSNIPIPLHLRNAPTKLMKEMGYSDGYKYNPEYTQGLVKQSYLPHELVGTKFVEDQHLGLVDDGEVGKEKIKLAEEYESQYEEFKKTKRERLRQDYEQLLLEERKSVEIMEWNKEQMESYYKWKLLKEIGELEHWEELQEKKKKVQLNHGPALNRHSSVYINEALMNTSTSFIQLDSSSVNPSSTDITDSVTNNESIEEGEEYEHDEGYESNVGYESNEDSFVHYEPEYPTV